MATHPYLYRRTSGTYYLRITVPKHVLATNPNSSRDIRLSLHTPYKTEAIQLAGYLRYQFHQLLDSSINQRFTLSGISFSRFITLKLKEIITRHHRNTKTMSEELIERPVHLTEEDIPAARESSKETESLQELPTITRSSKKDLRH